MKLTLPEALNSIQAQAAAIARPGQLLQLLPGIHLFAANKTTCALPGIYTPMAIVVLQGSMDVNLGQALLHYDPGTCFVGSIDLPVTSRITRASADRPFLAISIQLERDILIDILSEALEAVPEKGKCYALGQASNELLDACRRLLLLVERPRDLPVMAPMVRRELLYRLISGPQAAALHQIVVADPRVQQVRRALTWIRENLEKTVPIQDMATCAGMSQPSFHRHFRAATGMSPLQYQKALRLQAARRAILSGSEISHAAYSVGYESASQFSREYSRMFGVAPSRDLTGRRAAPSLGSASMASC